MATVRFSENNFLDLKADIDIADSPPEVLFMVKDEIIVVATFSGAIMDQNCMKVIRHVAIVCECRAFLLRELMNLLLDCGLLFLNCSFVSCQKTLSCLNLGLVCRGTLKVAVNIRHSDLVRTNWLAFFTLFYDRWLLAFFERNLSLEERDRLLKTFEGLVFFTSLKLGAKTFDFSFEAPCSFADTINAANVAFKKLIDVNCFIEGEFVEIFNQF